MSALNGMCLLALVEQGENKLGSTASMSKPRTSAQRATLEDDSSTIDLLQLAMSPEYVVMAGDVITIGPALGPRLDPTQLGEMCRVLEVATLAEFNHRRDFGAPHRCEDARYVWSCRVYVLAAVWVCMRRCRQSALLLYPVSVTQNPKPYTGTPQRQIKCSLYLSAGRSAAKKGTSCGRYL